jgi:CRP-like cAMP-binding protein
VPKRNHFLSGLSPADFDRLRPHLEHVELERDDLLVEPHAPLAAVYFPMSCILSVIVVMKDGREIESRTIGRESGYGLLNALGSRISFERVRVQIGGEACRLPIWVLSDLVEESPALLRAVASHGQATILQSAQSTACNAIHEVECRLCRWLLMTQDRLDSASVPLTQEHLSIMLGVQRTTITGAAQLLQEAGLISYSRGKIIIVDREGLERRACECYQAVREGAALTIGRLDQAAMLSPASTAASPQAKSG